MAMWIVIIKNVTKSSILVEDLGLPIDINKEINISEFFTYGQIVGSDDLRDLVKSGDLVLNNGTSDLSSSNGVKYLTLQNIEKL